MPFAPTDIAGCKLWVKADGTLWQNTGGTTPATADGDPVGRPDDGSGNGNNPLQATSANKPTLKLNILNGMPVFRFDGTNDTWLMSNTIAYGTIFAVANFNQAGNFPEYNGLLTTETGGATDGFIQADGSGGTNLYGGSPFFSAGHILVNGVETMVFAPLTTIKIIEAYRSSTTLSKTSLNFGKDAGAGASRYWKGDLGEVICYDSILSAANRTLVRTYLFERWATYQETGKAQTILAVLGKTDLAAFLDTGKATTLLAQMGETDQKALFELGKAVSLLAQMGATDGAAFSDLDTAEVVRVLQSAVDAAVYEDLLRGLTLRAVLGKTDTYHRVNAGTLWRPRVRRKLIYTAQKL